VFELEAGTSAQIALGDAHRIENPGTEELVVIEVQHGAHLHEDDIERLADDYGRR
jgi:mannose-6-phosphate isomerase